MENKNKLLNIFSIVVLSIALIVAVLFTALSGANNSYEIDIVNKTEEAVAVQGVFLSSGDATTASDPEFNNVVLGNGYIAMVTATVRPADAVDKSVSWSIAWENTCEEEISNIFTLSESDSPNASNGTNDVCYIRCEEPFGECGDAILTCTTTVGHFTATCRITWVGNIKVITTPQTSRESVMIEESVYVPLSYQFDCNGNEYRSDRNFELISVAQSGTITRRIWDTDYNSWYSSSDYDTIDFSSVSLDTSSGGDLDYWFLKANSSLNSSSLDKLLIYFNYNPYEDDNLIEGYAMQPNLHICPYTFTLNFDLTFRETTSNLTITLYYQTIVLSPALSDYNISF